MYCCTGDTKSVLLSPDSSARISCSPTERAVMLV
jgi:hypothetical protein